VVDVSIDELAYLSAFWQQISVCKKRSEQRGEKGEGRTERGKGEGEKGDREREWKKD
jgi:hypothetical protein